MNSLRNSSLQINKLVEAACNNTPCGKPRNWFNKQITDVFSGKEESLYSEARGLGKKLAEQVKSGEWDLKETRSDEAKTAIIIFNACRKLTEVYKTTKDIFSSRVKDFIYATGDELIESFHLHSQRRHGEQVSTRIMNLLNPAMISSKTSRGKHPNQAMIAA
jgi:hypothetical protein